MSKSFIALLSASVLLAACGGGGGGSNQTTGSTPNSPPTDTSTVTGDGSSLEPEPPETEEVTPEVVVSLAAPSGSRDRSWQNMLNYPSDLEGFLEENIANQNVPKPWFEAEFLDPELDR